MPNLTNRDITVATAIRTINYLQLAPIVFSVDSNVYNRSLSCCLDATA